jgi:alkylation response protein AidB-like acyl-CoA dehydrogenase
MDFDFTSEQLMLRDLTREFLNRESPPRAVRSAMEDPHGFNLSTWRQMAEMGLLGLAVEPGYGGQGLGMVELALVLDEMGRAAYPGPYFATAVLAGTAVVACGDGDQMARYLPDIARGRTRATVALIEDALTWAPAAVRLRATRTSDGYELSGTKRFVPFAQAADLVLVVARTSEDADGTTVFAVPSDAPGLSQKPNVEMDRTSPTSTLTFASVPVPADAVIGQVDRGWQIVDPMLQQAAVAASAEMLGASRRCMEMSVEYAKVRQQFGQPIGTFQAIKHACADMLLEVENAHAATYYAAWALDAGAADARLATSAAKAYVGDASRKVCGSAIQVHGGIGFTWEYDLHLYFKRAKHYEPLFGDADFHREQAVQLTLARGASDAEHTEDVATLTT